jgi:mono/diheme cytochrome c family protein
MKLGEIRHRHRFLLAGAGAVTLVLMGVVGGFVILLSGALSTDATTQHFLLTHRILDAGLRFSVNNSSEDIVAPPLNDRAMVDRGLACYREHCIQCHGSPGSDRLEEAKGLLPIPSSLAQSAREWPPESLYYITKKGVRMTGMPAWEFRISDEGLWSTTAFLTQLPFLTQEQYLQMEAATRSVPCPRNTESPTHTSAERADVLLRQYACHSCHRIEGVVGPKSYVGPPLIDWSRRKYIAGVMPNTPENLARWISDPKSVSPRTLMPDLDVAEPHAREMATYLMGLE